MIIFVESYSQIDKFGDLCLYFEKTVKYIELTSDESDIIHSEKFVIVVLDDTDLVNELNDYFTGKTIKNLKVETVLLKEYNHLPDCNVCFITENTKNIEIFETKPSVLYIGYNLDIKKNTIMINYKKAENNDIEIEINLQNVKKSEIEIYYLLYEIATVYK